jgi:hypothetical protein
MSDEITEKLDVLIKLQAIALTAAMESSRKKSSFCPKPD